MLNLIDVSDALNGARVWFSEYISGLNESFRNNAARYGTSVSVSMRPSVLDYDPGPFTQDNLVTIAATLTVHCGVFREIDLRWNNSGEPYIASYCPNPHVRSFRMTLGFNTSLFYTREEFLSEVKAEITAYTSTHIYQILVDYGIEPDTATEWLHRANREYHQEHSRIRISPTTLIWEHTQSSFNDISGRVGTDDWYDRLNPAQSVSRSWFPEGFDTDKAKTLLLDNLTPDQKTTWLAHKWFEVIGGVSGATYRILKGTQINIRKKTPDGWLRLCVVPDETLPLSDVVLSQKYMIEHYENDFEKIVLPWGIDSKILD